MGFVYNGECARRGPSNPPQPLPECLPRCWQSEVQADGEVGNVDAKLQGRCGDNAAQTPGPQRVLDCGTVLGLVTAPVRIDEIVLRLRGEPLHALSGVDESDEAARIGTVDERSLKVRNDAPCFVGATSQVKERAGMLRRSILIAVDDREIEACQGVEVLAWMRDRGACGNDRQGSVITALRSTQSSGSLDAPEQKCGIASEHGLQSVRFIDDQEVRSCEKVLGRRSGQVPHQPCVADIRGGDDDPRAIEGLFAVRYRHVSRDTRNPVSGHSRHVECPAPTHILVGRKCLQRIEYQNLGFVVFLKGLDGSRLEHEGLA